MVVNKGMLSYCYSLFFWIFIIHGTFFAINTIINTIIIITWSFGKKRRIFRWCIIL